MTRTQAKQALKILKFKTNKKIISLTTPKYFLSLKSSDNYCFIRQNFAIVITAFFERNNKLFVSGKRLLNCTNYFERPLKSMYDLSIFLSEPECNSLVENFEENLILFKLMRLPFDEKFLFLPILHSKIDIFPITR